MADCVVGGECVVRGGAGVVEQPKEPVLVEIPLVWWVRADRRCSAVHVRFDYAVAYGAGTACGLPVPNIPRCEERRTLAEVTCDNCLKALK